MEKVIVCDPKIKRPQRNFYVYDRYDQQQIRIKY